MTDPTVLDPKDIVISNLQAQLAETTRRLEAAEADVRRLCWIAPEGYNDLVCDLCAATADDGKGQEYLDSQHEFGCRAGVIR